MSERERDKDLAFECEDGSFRVAAFFTSKSCCLGKVGSKGERGN